MSKSNPSTIAGTIAATFPARAVSGVPKCPRMSHFAVRRVAQIASLALLAAAGCASKPASPSVATDEIPSLPADSPVPPLSTDGEPQRQRVVVDSVNDTVDRFDLIIKQREQAKRNAVDLRETREAAGLKPDAKPQAEDEAATIEKLAAKLREGKPIDPPAGEVAANPPRSNVVSPADPRSEDWKAAEVSTANRPLDPNAPVEAPSDTASGALAASTGVEVTRGGAPTISRGSAVDPWINVQQKYATRVADDPRDLSAQLDLQLARFLQDEPVPMMSDLAALPAEDRELLAAMCDALSNFRSVVRGDGNPLSSVKARPFIEMADRIRARADLTLSGLTLCSKVTSFGVYDEIKPLVFQPNVENRAVVYCEVDGFISQLNADQKWETKLSLELKLYDDHGLQIWNVPANPTTDLASRRRRDFWLAKIITLPPNLAGGHYMLKAQVRDLLGNRVNEQTIQFAVKDNGAAVQSNVAAGAGPAAPRTEQRFEQQNERRNLVKEPVK
jgi:hypothetical protein